MEISIILQARQAVAAIVLGICAGLLYDFFRALRRRFPSASFTAVLDALFWIICAFSAFLFGMLRSASVSMNLTNQVSSDMITVLQGLVVVLVASPMVWTVLDNLVFSCRQRLLGRRAGTNDAAGGEGT